MRKFVLLFVLVCFSALSFGQPASGKWNSATATYINAKYGVRWQLYEDGDWVERPILTNDAIFKMRDDNYHILVKLIVETFEGPAEDVWAAVPMFQAKEYQKKERANAKAQGMELKSFTAAKTVVSGLHATRTKSHMTKYYRQYKETIHAIDYTYYLSSGRTIYTVSITALSLRDDELTVFDKLRDTLINGFTLNNL